MEDVVKTLEDHLEICVSTGSDASANPVGGFHARAGDPASRPVVRPTREEAEADRKSTRLNSSHITISYAVFCLKKKKQQASVQHDHL